MLENHNAAELAEAIGYLSDSQLTGPLSMIDEASGKFARISGEVAAASRAFSEARSMHQRSWDPAAGRYSDETWRSAMSAAEVLADALRTLHRQEGGQ
jgi:uncharacterized protein YukE